MNQPTLRILGVVICGIVLAMSLMVGGTAWTMSGAIADGAYDPVRDDRATPGTEPGSRPFSNARNASSIFNS